MKDILKNITKIQDNDGHWYWITHNILDEFNLDLYNITGIEYMDNPDAFDIFIDKYDKYRTYGDPDNTPDIFNENITTTNSALEKLLIVYGFELKTYYKTNKYFCKQISNQDQLCIRIFSDVDEIVSVEYEHIPLDKYDKYAIVSFKNIKNTDKLMLLIEALS